MVDNEMIKKACKVELIKEIKYHVTISNLAHYTYIKEEDWLLSNLRNDLDRIN